MNSTQVETNPITRVLFISLGILGFFAPAAECMNESDVASTLPMSSDSSDIYLVWELVVSVANPFLAVQCTTAIPFPTDLGQISLSCP
jgi:hypothetical protein